PTRANHLPSAAGSGRRAARLRARMRSDGAVAAHSDGNAGRAPEGRAPAESALMASAAARPSATCAGRQAEVMPSGGRTGTRSDPGIGQFESEGGGGRSPDGQQSTN